MKKYSIDQLLDYAQLRLTHLWLLARKLSQLFDRELKERTNNFSQNYNQFDNTLFEQMEKEGILTPRNLKTLSTADPDKVEFFIGQLAQRITGTLLLVDIGLLKDVFPNIVWSSIFVISMGHFEDSLKRISDLLGEQKGCKIKVNDLYGLSISEKSKKFLTDVVLFDFDFGSSKSWNFIKNHQSVRNLVIHNGGYLDDSSFSNKAKGIIMHEPELSVNKDKMIIFSEAYVLKVIERVSLFFEEITGSLRKS